MTAFEKMFITYNFLSSRYRKTKNAIVILSSRRVEIFVWWPRKVNFKVWPRTGLSILTHDAQILRPYRKKTSNRNLKSVFPLWGIWNNSSAAAHANTKKGSCPPPLPSVHASPMMFCVKCFSSYNATCAWFIETSMDKSHHSCIFGITRTESQLFESKWIVFMSADYWNPFHYIVYRTNENQPHCINYDAWTMLRLNDFEEQWAAKRYCLKQK